MPITFTQFLDDCYLVLGTGSLALYPRETTLIPWAKEAMLSFPILRPVDQEVTLVAPAKNLQMDAGFREMISVEYPVHQDPPEFLHRFSHFDPGFYSADDHYDIDRDYGTGYGWMLYLSTLIPAAVHSMTINFLANHDVAIEDDDTDVITVPDEYEHILLSYINVKACRERLNVFMQSPTVFSNLIQQMIPLVTKSEEIYLAQVAAAQAGLSTSRISPAFKSDRFDRVY